MCSALVLLLDARVSHSPTSWSDTLELRGDNHACEKCRQYRFSSVPCETANTDDIDAVTCYRVSWEPSLYEQLSLWQSPTATFSLQLLEETKDSTFRALWRSDAVSLTSDTTYSVNVSSGLSGSAAVSITEKTANRRTPEEFVADVACGLFMSIVLYHLYRRAPNARPQTHSFSTPSNRQRLLPANEMPRSSRFLALDVFRGLTIAFMIFCNYGGGGLSPFQHSAWNGLTVADILFPWFAFIMGFSHFLASNSHPFQLSKTLLRSTKLFCLGLVINTRNLTSWVMARIPGVLQALAIAYLLVSIVTHILNDRVSPNRSIQKALQVHILLGFVPMLTINLLLTFVLPVPGCPTGYIGPGGVSDHGLHYFCTGGAHLYLDEKVFGRKHIYQHPTVQKVYMTGPYDPEGLLNWLMVAATAYIGYICAMGMNSARSATGQAKWLIGIGSGLLITAAIVAAWWIPINKNLWSLSYVLTTSGLACLVLEMLWVSVDSPRQCWSGYPFASLGKNAILIYVLHEICHDFAPFMLPPGRIGEIVPKGEMVLFNSTAALWWIFVAVWLHARELFVRV